MQLCNNYVAFLQESLRSHDLTTLVAVCKCYGNLSGIDWMAVAALGGWSMC